MENTLALAVLNETRADKLAAASEYVCHPIGGILRSLRVGVRPNTSLSSLRVATVFDADFKNARLELELEAAQDGPPAAGELAAHFFLTAPDGRPVELSPERAVFSSLKARVTIPIAAPLHWDPEHPNLYRLMIELAAGGQRLETVEQKVGFRQIDLRGNELLVNGRPVKLRGVNHHETYPTTGRAVPPGVDLKDVTLFREGNVNLMRTSQYPPTTELLEAADELGMFIECEAPVCWDEAAGAADLICQETAEMALADRNHPCILFWSLGNESKWGAHSGDKISGSVELGLSGIK